MQSFPVLAACVRWHMNTVLFLEQTVMQHPSTYSG